MLSQAQQRKHGQYWVVKLSMKFNSHNFSIKKKMQHPQGLQFLRFTVYVGLLDLMKSKTHQHSIGLLQILVQDAELWP